MKQFLTTIALTVCINSFGQDSLPQITKSWEHLKTQLKRRGDIVANLSNLLANSPKIDQKILVKSKSISDDFFNYIDTLKTSDSVSVAIVQTKNLELLQTLTKLLIAIDSDTKLKKSPSLANLQMQLEGCENRIVVARRNYNDTCIKYNRPDLILNSKPKTDLEVKF